MGQPRMLAETDCGVDYLTCTFKPSTLFGRLQLRVERIARREIQRGNFKREWTMSGYTGFKVGGLQCGAREDGMIVRLSGPTAQDHWRKIGSLASNCSRIDVQVTVLYDENVTTTLTRHWREMKRWNKTLKRPPKLVQWSDAVGVGTIYSGARQSLCYGRCYNKYLQSGLDHQRNHLRYEVEFKGEMSKLILAQLLDHKVHLKFVREQCQALFMERGCRLRLTNDAERRLRRHMPASDVSGRLQWLRKGVAGTISELCAMGYAEDVIEALGLKDHFETIRPAWSNSKRVA